ncbi:hypothetical protein [Rhizobium leguminosarum]|nr:hypothetical protein [Rhizobium leguminosarum]
MEQELSYRQKADAAVRDLLLEFECRCSLFVCFGVDPPLDK